MPQRLLLTMKLMAMVFSISINDLKEETNGTLIIFVDTTKLGVAACIREKRDILQRKLKKLDSSAGIKRIRSNLESCQLILQI